MSGQVRAWYATCGDECIGIIYAESRKDALAKAVEISGLDPEDFADGADELRREPKFDRYAPNDPPPQAWFDAGYVLPCSKCGEWIEDEEVAAAVVMGEDAYHAGCAPKGATPDA